MTATPSPESQRPGYRIIPAITLWQPWACLIEIGAKCSETRLKPAPVRLIGQRVAIHAAKRPQRKTDLNEETFEAMCDVFGGHHFLQMLPLGVVVCTAVIEASLPTKDVAHDLFGDYRDGRWAWLLSDIRPIRPHIPARGMQTWGWPWHVPEGVII